MTIFCSWEEKNKEKNVVQIIFTKYFKIVAIHHMDCPHPKVP